MLTLYDEFAGAGGSTEGASSVPGVQPIQAANHNKLALETHGRNHPGVDHILGDVLEMRITRFARADIFWASPACPPWTDARGKKRDFDKSTYQALDGMPDDGATPDEQTMRARKLMEEIPRYLGHWALRGKPILAGVVENVIQCRKWAEWHRWLGEIRALGYETRVIAFNSMHARPPNSPRAPQSRDRLYVAYWLTKLGRRPDFDKWLRPAAYCPSCDQVINAIQVFKRAGVDMGRYGKHGQYVYKCPHHSCRGRIVEPGTIPALMAIDWSLPGTPIGEREQHGLEPLAPNTLDRVRAGLKKYAIPVLAPAGGTWRESATPVDEPMPTRTTRENDGVAVPMVPIPITVEAAGHTFERRPGVRTRSITDPVTTQTTTATKALAVPPLMVPVEGRPGKTATAATDPMRTQTARNETGMAYLPFVVPMRGGGDKEKARDVVQPLHTVTAGGNHHGLALPEPLIDAAMIVRHNSSRGDGGEMSSPIWEPLRTLTSKGHQSLVSWADLLVPYYTNGTTRPATEPVGTLSTKDRYALLSSGSALASSGDIDLDEVRFRMLEPHEIQRAMAFPDDYVICGSAKRDRVRQLGNAVTPPVAELIVSALVECITGEPLEVAS
ncbi:DNA cytosine methyltransferase [Actinomadura scrupuli]|uniref:DNA cytosine methyltransferase n=1 Tax=Actinomadura scrupuli TaxID=559629 RepID=UPI003D9625AE